jgi:shikimate kinase
MKKDIRIFLLGFMGAGKTYWGEKMAALTGFAFVDLDNLVEQHSSSSIPELFEQFGESTFRQIERECLLKCAHLQQTIVATGGGTPCFFDNMQWMKACGKTIYLKVPANILALRLRRMPNFRPLLAGIEEHLLDQHIERLLLERERFYLQADQVLGHEEDEAALQAMLLQSIQSWQ